MRCIAELAEFSNPSGVGVDLSPPRSQQQEQDFHSHTHARGAHSHHTAAAENSLAAHRRVREITNISSAVVFLLCVFAWR